MLRPSGVAVGNQRRVAKLRLPRLVESRRPTRTGAVAMLTLGALSLTSVTGSPGVVGALGSAPATVANGDRSVLSVELAVAGDPVSQANPAGGVTDVGDAPVGVVSVTIDAGGPLTLIPRGGDAEVTGISYPADLTGVAAVENGVQIPATSADFDWAAERIFSSSDLRDYVLSDGQNLAGAEWGADYDIRYATPLTSDDFLLISERDGNAPFHLLALDGSGNPVPGATPVQVSAPYSWNTGIAPIEEPGQPFHLSVVDIEAFAPTGTAVHGFRVDNNGEADIKLTPLQVGGEAPLDPEPLPEPVPDPAPQGGATSGAVSLVKAVYRGHDGGAGCAAATTWAEAAPTDQVTYCFTVTNTGTDHLADLTISDPSVVGEVVAVSADSSPLAPGDSARFLLETIPPADDADGVLDDTHTNTATVSARTVDAGSAPAGPGEVTATAQAVVFPPAVNPTPSVTLITSVYAGHDNGIGCPAADVTTVDEGADVTYCFQVTNVGTTHLDPLGITDPLVTGTPILLRADSTPLAPGDSAYYHLDQTAPALPADGFTSAATVVANSVDETGADLAGLDDVTSTDGARILTAAQASEAPQQLAFTGLETWLFAIAGAGLIAGGWLVLLNPRRDLHPATAGAETTTP